VKNKLTKHDEKVLAGFLRKHRQDKALSLLQTQGFLFCVACCPELVAPSEWVPLVLEDTAFDNAQETQQITEMLMVLYNQINHQVLHGTAKLPKACRILPDTMRNFADPAPLHQWSQGFMKGYSWLSECWGEFLETDDEAQQTFTLTIMVLGVAASRSAFAQALADKPPEEQRQTANAMLALLPDAVKGFAKAARLMRSPTPSHPHANNARH
jgi:uncharacterized protein